MTVIVTGGGGGGGGGALASINNRFFFKIEETSEEKHSLTRNLVGYRNYRQRWCKKEENKCLGKDK